MKTFKISYNKEICVSKTMFYVTLHNDIPKNGDYCYSKIWSKGEYYILIEHELNILKEVFDNPSSSCIYLKSSQRHLFRDILIFVMKNKDKYKFILEEIETLIHERKN